MDSASILLGYPISAGGLDENVHSAWDILQRSGGGHYLACANPHSLVVAKDDSAFSKALKEADILLPDGIGVVLARMILRQPGFGRVAGFEFFIEFSKKAHQAGGIRYFFLGASQIVLERVVKRMKAEFPKIEIAGVYSPPFVDEFSKDDNQKMLEAIHSAKPHVLWVGMTAPKQEKWIAKNRKELNVPLACAVGAVFDFYAGTRERASEWVCKLGLEWLPRLLHEPRRLWRRSLLSAPIFFYLILKSRFNPSQ